jgi:hypothetical protein
MEPKVRRPAWWVLYLILVGMLGLILLESQDGASNMAHEIIDGVIVIGFFGGVLGWVRFNESALERAEMEHVSLGEFHIVEYGPTQPTYTLKDSPDAPKRPEGVKSNVADGDYILFPLMNN